MFALDVETAKTVAIVAVGAFVLFGILSAWLVKTVVTKVIMIVVMAGLAVAAFSQRASLDDCATRAKDAVGDVESVECTFFGTTIDVPTGG